MSGAPKRGSQEEGVHSSSSSVRPDYGGDEESHAYPWGTYSPVSDNRRLSRVDSRDGEQRRSPLNSMYRMPSSGVGDSHSSHTSHSVGGSTEVRVESKESKGSENSREPKVESKDVHPPSGKVDDGKEAKYERDRVSDLKSEVKVEKDALVGGAVAGMYQNWKDPNRGKRNSDVAGGGGGILGPWSNSHLRAKYDAAKEATKEALKVVVKDRVDGNEAVGENRVDSKTDDKYKDRKRKEGKHFDWPESDKDKSDYRSNMQPGSSSNNEFKEGTKEEKVEMEKTDISKEKEKLKEREKEHVEKEGKNGGEKEGHVNDKDVSGKSVLPENSTSESKKPSDSWRNLEREAKERRREREGDVEGERPEKRRCHEKEANDGVADVGEGTDKERDAFNYGVHQKKRMLRARGSPQVGNRDARFKSRGQDAEGSQGKAEVSAVYNVGECLQELTKLWKEYESSQVDKSSENLYSGPTLEIRIPAEHVTATNRQVRGGQLWGTDIYTDDSDLVAVLMHTGYCRPSASPPPAAIQELRATVRVLPPQESYVSTLRNNVRSRAWGAAIGCSYRVERCCIMKKGGGTIDLEPCLTHTSTIEPTLAPVAVERTMTTRAAASNALRQQRFVREVTIQYNLCNEPWIKYSISIVADKGLKKPLYTSARLKKGEVLYLETHSCRYELCFASEKIVKNSSVSQMHESETGNPQNHVPSVNGDRNMADGDNIVVDMFRWSKCKKPLPQKVMRSIGIPLPLDHVEVLEENLDWEDVQWSQTGVWIAGKEYQLARVHFLSPN